MADGSLAEREPRNPQGSAVSPVLADLFLHYAFDMWLARKFPAVPFERIRRRRRGALPLGEQARMIRATLEERMGQVGLSLHPDKTRLVYCKDGTRRGSAGTRRSASWVHLPGAGRAAAGTGGYSPGSARRSARTPWTVSAEVRSWRLHQHSDSSFGQVARWLNPRSAGLDAVLRGVLPLRAVYQC